MTGTIQWENKKCCTLVIVYWKSPEFAFICPTYHLFECIGRRQQHQTLWFFGLQFIKQCQPRVTRLVCTAQSHYTIKLRYNGFAYNISSVIANASSRSRHFSIQNMSVSMYLDIMYSRLLRTDFLGPNPTTDPASTYVPPPSRRLRIWLQSITCRQSARHFAIPVSDRGCWFASNCC